MRASRSASRIVRSELAGEAATGNDAASFVPVKGSTGDDDAEVRRQNHSTETGAAAIRSPNGIARSWSYRTGLDANRSPHAAARRRSPEKSPSETVADPFTSTPTTRPHPSPMTISTSLRSLSRKCESAHQAAARLASLRTSPCTKLFSYVANGVRFRPMRSGEKSPC